MKIKIIFYWCGKKDRRIDEVGGFEFQGNTSGFVLGVESLAKEKSILTLEREREGERENLQRVWHK